MSHERAKSGSKNNALGFVHIFLATHLHLTDNRIQAAEERYSSEVLAHAEALKTISDIKDQLARARVAARENQNASETAQAKLATSEASWRQQREALDKEIAELNKRCVKCVLTRYQCLFMVRCKDLNEQNSLLHQHLESVSSQAARIKQAADTSAPATSDADDTDAKVSELRSVVSYLRREKEIVELQLELSKQENTRLKTQVDHLSHALEDTRKALSEVSSIGGADAR